MERHTIILALIAIVTMLATEGKKDGACSSGGALEKMQCDIKTLTEKLTACSQRVAFQAVRKSTGHPVFYSVPIDQNIVYDETLLNIGDDYNTTTGIFRCRVPGVYYFAVHAISPQVRNLDRAFLYLMHNNKYVAAAGKPKNGIWETISMSAIIDLNSGDEVMVKVFYRTATLYEWEASHYNQFNGQLVYPAGCR